MPLDLSKLFSSMDDALIIVDESNLIIEANERFCEIFGYSYDEIINQNINILIPESMRSKYMDNLKKYTEGKINPHLCFSKNIYAIHKEGYSIPVMLTMTKSIVGADTFYICIFRNKHFNLDVLSTRLDKLSIRANQLLSKLGAISTL